HDAALARLADEVFQPREILLVPAFQVELVAAVAGAGLVAPRPRGQEAAGGRREGVLDDVERAGYLAVGAGEGARQVELARPQLVQVRPVIEVAVKDRPVVFAGGDEHGGLAAEEEVTRV